MCICYLGFTRDICKMGSWNHMGCTENMIIKGVIRQMCMPFENSVYFGDGDDVNSNPGYYRNIFPLWNKTQPLITPALSISYQML